MFSWWMRYLPYALVYRLAKRKAERFPPDVNGSNAAIQYAMPFKGEFIGWRTLANPDEFFNAQGKMQRISEDPCFQIMKPEEPFFILLGRDEDAAMALSIWIALRQARDGRDESKVNAAKATWARFAKYRETNVVITMPSQATFKGVGSNEV